MKNVGKPTCLLLLYVLSTSKDGHRLVTARTHADFVVLPHWENCQLVLCPNFPVTLSWHWAYQSLSYIQVISNDRLCSDKYSFCKSLDQLHRDVSNSWPTLYRLVRSINFVSHWINLTRNQTHNLPKGKAGLYRFSHVQWKPKSGSCDEAVNTEIWTMRPNPTEAICLKQRG